MTSDLNRHTQRYNTHRKERTKGGRKGLREGKRVTEEGKENTRWYKRAGALFNKILKGLT